MNPCDICPISHNQCGRCTAAFREALVRRYQNAATPKDDGVSNLVARDGFEPPTFRLWA